MENLYVVLTVLTSWCLEQPGAVLWTLFQTKIEHRTGYQILLCDHANDGAFVWQHNTTNLAQMSVDIEKWLQQQAEQRRAGQ